MRFQQTFSQLLALTLTIAAIAGCGAQAPDNTAGSAEITADTAAASIEISADAAADSTESSADAAADSTESSADTAATISEEDTADAVPPVTTGGSPWIDSDIKANITEDMDPSPTEDFHLCVNRDWILETEIEPGQRYNMSFIEVKKEIDRKALELLRDDKAEGHDAELVQTLYRAFLDWDARNAAGVEPLRKTVEEISRIDSLDALSAFICDLDRSFFTQPFVSISIDYSREDASRYITGIYSEDFTLDDSAEYEERTELGDLYYEAMLHKTIAMLTRLGYTEEQAKTMFDAKIGLESKLAEVSFSDAEFLLPESVQKTNNTYSPDEIAELSPVFPLADMIEGYGYGESKEFRIPEPEYIMRLSEIYTEENLEALKDYLIINYVNDSAYFLDREAYELDIETDNMIDGSTGMKTDEVAAFDTVRSFLWVPMNKAFVERYDFSEAKEQITELCRDIIDTYSIMLAGEDWLSDETRAKAIEKLNAMRINAVYPEKWEDYSGLDLSGLSYFECTDAASFYNKKIDCSYTNGTVDKDIWDFDILANNASYGLSTNSINIYLGLLGGVFYHDGISYEELLGGLGTVIGHEISHAFDTNGAQYDKNGSLTNWWTEEDYAAFTERADKLIKYYDGITVWDGRDMIGKNVQSEAIADMAGMKVILTIAKEQENFDYEAFFRAYATMWRRINTREMELYTIKRNPHPLHYLRTNVTVQQFDEFLDTFGVKEGDTMYLAPEDRVLVW